MEHRSYMRRRLGTSIVCILAFSLSLSVESLASEPIDEAEERGFEVIRTVPLQQTSFTQGLEVLDESIFQSSGLYGESRLSEIDLQSGNILREMPINDSYFAEGITVLGESIIMLTWKEEQAFRIDISNFSIIENYSFDGEGWGICFNGEYLVMSNGTSEISFRDPYTFEINHTIQVTWNGQPVSRINELECVGGEILANVWLQDVILSIDSISGSVQYFISPTSITSMQGNNSNEVLNGIAFDKSSGGFWITGKNWTHIYLIEISDLVSPDEIQETNQLASFSAIAIISIILILLFLGSIRNKKEPETPNFKDSPS
ncbi:MAG: glutaminyl-peptide cyclotransferase [Candidatus Thalassarchaeaceae archaeon]